MSEISEAARRRVRECAGNRCEYCLSHQDHILGRLQMDHIQPGARGGSDDEDDLCLACELCNQKWTPLVVFQGGRRRFNELRIIKCRAGETDRFLDQVFALSDAP